MTTDMPDPAEPPSLAFPDGFLWGAATAAHQVEGNNLNNQWWDWEQAGRVHGTDSARVALDWWRGAEADFDLARQLGLNALRLSLEWSRIEPEPGLWSGEAIARYREMLEGLHARGLAPLVTLHHFTNPLWFEGRGGWLAPDAGERFERYVRHVVTELGDLCDFWCTINEPNIYAAVGYVVGIFPPGREGDILGALRVVGAMLHAHAAAYRTIRALQPTARVGWAQNYNTFDPANPRSPLDRFAAGLRSALLNDLFPRAVLGGSVPLPLRPLVGDLAAVAGTCDYIGINTYYRDRIRFDWRRPRELFARTELAPGARVGDQPAGDWSWGELYPQGIARIAGELKRYGKPLYVTESGVADQEDRLRPWVLARAVRAMHDAIRRGADVRGYFHWTLVDNFEWAEGYSTRFGLVALDVESGQRTPRPSAGLYGQIARANALGARMLRDFGPEVVAAAFPEVPVVEGATS